MLYINNINTLQIYYYWNCLVRVVILGFLTSISIFILRFYQFVITNQLTHLLYCNMKKFMQVSYIRQAWVMKNFLKDDLI